MHAHPGVFLGHESPCSMHAVEILRQARSRLPDTLPLIEASMMSKFLLALLVFSRENLNPTAHIDKATQDMQVSLSPLNKVDLVACDF